MDTYMIFGLSFYFSSILFLVGVICFSVWFFIKSFLVVEKWRESMMLSFLFLGIASLTLIFLCLRVSEFLNYE